MHSALPQILLGILILLSAAIVVVPLLKRAGLGAVLGYVFAGALLGPFGVGFVHEPETFLEVSEFGVVLLLFVIGLELQPARLWLMRQTILGFGGVQVLASAAILAGIAAALGLPAPAAITVGLALSLSSTAFALQMLAERRELTATHGRVALGMLLFQDLAAIPIIALVPLLGDSGGTFGWQAIAYALGAVAAVIVIGRYLLRYALRLVAAAGTQELFTASALATVVGTALVMHVAGLSMALGGFLAGVLLADSQYRHALEADIEPFKGLLLGVFFIAVGMSVDLPLILAQWPTVLGIAGGLIAVKTAVTYLTARAWGMPRGPALRLGVVISEGGEFAFVILAAAVAGEVVPAAQADVLVAAVIVSMILFAAL
ncbi:MAG TPA: monovalent cation:proton antiporter-2 (CPA2) family protein, partial [Gammaproteobacteria bacterium]|nr:monovalent cation:proton antiporter-2 (CPA2) family protein [Gammaproteobacteria bacterium]